MTTLNELVAGKQPMAAPLRTTTLTICDPVDGATCGACFACKIRDLARLAVEQARMDHLSAQARVNDLHAGLTASLHALKQAAHAAERDLPMTVDQIEGLGLAIAFAERLVGNQPQVVEAQVVAEEPAA